QQERGERRVDERQLRRPELQRVEHRRLVPHGDAAVPVDGRVDLGPVVLRGRVDEQGVTGRGQQEQCDRGHEPGGWPYSIHRSVSSALEPAWSCSLIMMSNLAGCVFALVRAL